MLPVDVIPYRRTIVLEGPWELGRYEKPPRSGPPVLDDVTWVPASVPGAVQYDLVREGLLANPFASTQDATAAGWVAGSDWVYRTTFAADHPAQDQEIRLVLDGVDTYADIWVNGQLVGKTANNYRSYTFPLTPGVLVRENTLVVHVKAHQASATSQIEQAKARLGTSVNPAKAVIRRYQRSFYSNSSLLNLGTDVLGIGINRPVRLATLPAFRIHGTHFRTRHLSPDQAKASVEVELGGSRDGGPDQVVKVSARLSEQGSEKPAAEATANLADGGPSRAHLELLVPNPRPWWPAGYGEPHLYVLRVELEVGGKVVDAVEQNVGLKVVEIAQRLPNGRRTFRFVVNGQQIFVRGFNLVPLDYIKVHGEPTAYERLFELMSAAGTNMVRNWGGGTVEDDAFYASCDERGILLWQDFFLHSATYPDYDTEWVEELRAESEELVGRLRNHACLGALCGGNETIQGWDEWGWQGKLDRFYGENLIRGVLPEVAGRLCPDVPYVVNSPHGGKVSHSPIEGDMHCWGNFFNATKDPLFVTETCWNIQSYSRPSTLRATMGLRTEDYAELGWPLKWKATTGLNLVTKYPYSDCFESRTLAGYLDSLEVEQARADHYALQMMRARSSSCTGIVWWPLNKGAPLFEFGCVDYLGKPLMSYYVIKRWYADVVVAVYQDLEDVVVVGSNVGRTEVRGTLRVAHVAANGSLLGQWDEPVRIEPGAPTKLWQLPGMYGAVVDRAREVVDARLLVGDEVLSEDTLYFCPLAEFETDQKPVAVRSRATGKGSWALDIEASSMVKLLRLEAEPALLFSDNYFSMGPGRKTVHVRYLGDVEGTSPEVGVSALGVAGADTVRLPPA